MSFSYCMYGASMGTLQVVQVLSGQETVLFSESDDTGPVWVSSSVELNGNGVTVRAQLILLHWRWLFLLIIFFLQKFIMLGIIII